MPSQWDVIQTVYLQEQYTKIQYITVKSKQHIWQMYIGVYLSMYVGVSLCIGIMIKYIQQPVPTALSMNSM